MEVSSSSIKAAMVTVTAMNHGLIAVAAARLFIVRSGDAVWSAMVFSCVLAHTYRGFNRHARTQLMLRVLILVDPDADGEALHDLHVVAACVLRREQAEERTGRAGHIVDRAVIVTAEGIHMK